MDHLLGSADTRPFGQIIGEKITHISAEVSDPGYETYKRLHADGLTADVYLDNVEQDDVITADSKEGYVKRMVRDEDGHAFVYNGELANETVKGKVRIDIRPL